METHLNTIRSLVPFVRPLRFTDPYGDWNGCEELHALPLKPPDELSERELMAIFASYLPLGAYDESGYYIPQVLSFIKRTGSPDLIENFLIWLSHERRFLSGYSELMDAVRLDMTECFQA